MTAKIKLLVAIDMLFLLLLAISGATAGIISEIFYYLAFLAPVGIAINYIYTSDKTSHAPISETKYTVPKDLKRDFSLSKENLLFALPIFVPAIITIFSLSVLTSLFMGIFGLVSTAEFDEPFITAIITHALVPAFLEELLFRFVPIKLLSDNKKSAFLVSSVLFAFAHANLFQIPYAFLAGAVFSGLYMMTGSILPCVLLHFFNNLLSLLSIYGYLKNWTYPIIFVLLCISVAVIAKRKESYKQKLNEMLPKEIKIELSYHPLIFIAISLILAISALFA